MWNRLRSAAMGSMVVILATTTACGSDNAAPKSSTAPATPSTQMNSVSSPAPHSLSQEGQGMRLLSTDDATIPLKAIGGVNYVSAADLAKTVRFQTDWSERGDSLLIGDNDASYEMTMNSTKAMKDGNEIHVSSPFIKEGNAAYIPVSALGDLFQEDMSFDVKDGSLRIHPSSVITIEHEDDPNPGNVGVELDFGDDPSDPFKGGEDGANPASGGVQLPEAAELEAWVADVNNEDAVPVLKNIDINALIRKGRQYMGVKYKFGAGPYPSSGRFDCSTFTQYVFGKYGVKLPRLARQQAANGTLISRKNLRKGDLMFFYVPGRFKSNKTVGHVGIYIGNMQMLHASPEPKNGVQISSIDKAYWKETFLKARRVAY